LVIAIMLAASACAHVPPVQAMQDDSESISEAAVPSEVATSFDVERWLASVINRERRSAHLPLLRSDDRVSVSARKRSSLARSANGSPVPVLNERLSAESVFPVSSSEISLTSGSISSLVKDCSAFRASAQKPDVTHVGIGVVVDAVDHRVYATVIYVQFPPYIDASAVARRLLPVIDALEDSRANNELCQIAQQYAEGLATGASREELWSDTRNELNRVSAHRFVDILNSAIATADVDHVDVERLVRGRRANDIGVGVAQSSRYGRQGGMSWIVVVFAQRPRGSGDH
jgi:hypothetical protein